MRREKTRLQQNRNLFVSEFPLSPPFPRPCCRACRPPVSIHRCSGSTAVLSWLPAPRGQTAESRRRRKVAFFVRARPQSQNLSYRFVHVFRTRSACRSFHQTTTCFPRLLAQSFSLLAVRHSTRYLLTNTQRRIYGTLIAPQTCVFPRRPIAVLRLEAFASANRARYSATLEACALQAFCWVRILFCTRSQSVCALG